MSTSTNSFLRGQRKSDLLELAETVGLKNTDGLKKNDLEVALDDYLTENQSYSLNPKAAPFYQSRARATGSPLKKDMGEPRKRRVTSKLADRPTSASADDDSELPSSGATPGNSAMSLARRVPLPSSPADVKRIVDERTLAVRERVSSFYSESGVKDIAYETRATLSQVTSIISCISAFELYHLRREILSDRYAFTIPGSHLLGTSDYPVQVPDMFLLLQGSFWSPFLLWLATSVAVPVIFGFYFNLSAAHSATGSRRRSAQPDFSVDPLTFSVAKAVITYVVYQQGASFNGWVNQDAVARINSAVYGGWKGVLTGAFISGLASVYDAALSK
ncbi:unnamed protein product [Discula destructiva]